MKLIKKLSIFALVGFSSLAVTSCLNNDDNNDSTPGFFETTIVEVNKDSINPVGKMTNINVSFNLSNSCQKFENFTNIGSNYDTIYIGVAGSQSYGSNCTQKTVLKTEVLQFTPKKAADYYLKFWTGKYENGKNKYGIVKKITIKAQ
ncbi:hypothetical protein [Algoriella sp.]|uniref:hypothetical protein n=1 Tax=Algoriella sp. TaxID=1872434 RepID=UPI001B217A11|nr:hypothetical protein [Algoriella sp.]MBO6212203.1 hypothetical protein [Algoriella sp.]